MYFSLLFSDLNVNEIVKLKYSQNRVQSRAVVIISRKGGLTGFNNVVQDYPFLYQESNELKMNLGLPLISIITPIK